jgi:hypothetical protein
MPLTNRNSVQIADLSRFRNCGTSEKIIAKQVSFVRLMNRNASPLNHFCF